MLLHVGFSDAKTKYLIPLLLKKTAASLHRGQPNLLTLCATRGKDILPWNTCTYSPPPPRIKTLGGGGGGMSLDKS